MDRSIPALERLRQLAPFDCLPRSALESLHGAVVWRRPVEGERLIEENANPAETSLFAVLSGRVRLVEPERRTTVRQLRAGQVFGHFALLRELPAPYRAECAEAGELLEIEGRTVRTLCKAHPVFANWLHADLRRFERELGAFDDVIGSRFLFGQRLGDLARVDVPSCDSQCSIRDAARAMSARDSDCVIVLEAGRPIGLVSDRDLRDRVLAAGLDATRPLTDLVDAALPTIGPLAPVFDGLMAMEAHGRRHLALVDQQGAMRGAVSDGDLARMLLTSPAALHRRLQQADSGEALRELRGLADRMIVTLYRRGVRAEDLLRINTRFNDALTSRVLAIVVAGLAEAPSDLRWSWLSLGSEGRGEMGLRTDQDNAIVYECADEKAADTWLERLAIEASRLLDAAGIAFCDGGIMAREAPMRQTLEGWRQSLDQWMVDADDVRVLWLGALADSRCLQGDAALWRALIDTLDTAFRKRPRTLQVIAREALVPALPIRRFPTRKLTGRRDGDSGPTLNLKRQGTHLIVNLARWLCLEAGRFEPSGTVERLATLAELDPRMRSTADEATTAYGVFADLRLSWAVEQVDRGETPDDRMPVARIGETRRQIVMAAYGTVEDIRAPIRYRIGMQR